MLARSPRGGWRTRRLPDEAGLCVNRLRNGGGHALLACASHSLIERVWIEESGTVDLAVRPILCERDALGVPFCVLSAFFCELVMGPQKDAIDDRALLRQRYAERAWPGIY